MIKFTHLLSSNEINAFIYKGAHILYLIYRFDRIIYIFKIKDHLWQSIVDYFFTAWRSVFKKIKS